MTWLTEQEAADYLKVKRRNLQTARYTGKVIGHKLCGVVQYRKEDLDDFRERSKWEGKQKDINLSKDKTVSGISTTRDLGALVAQAKEIVKSQRRY